MLKSKLVACLVAAGAASVGLVALTTGVVEAQSGTGALRGIVKNKKTGESIAGATIVATSPALVGEQISMSDENGGYFITALPPGMYTLTIYYNDSQFTRENVLVQLGKESFVNIPIVDEAAAKGEIIKIEEKFVPVVDQGSSKLANTITRDFTRNVPTGRTFAEAIGTAAGSQGDSYGTSLAGATSAENVYIVEGMNTTDVATGVQSANLPSEFIQETEIISGGYNAEFGRATGGIINVVTKSGSDEFHGTIFGSWRPGALASKRIQVPDAAQSINSESQLNYNADVGLEVGGPIIKKKLWFHFGINPTFSSSTINRIVNTLVDVNGDGEPDVDDNDLVIGRKVSDRDYRTSSQRYYMTGKINGAISENHLYQVTASGNPTSATSLRGLSLDPNDSMSTSKTQVFDISAKWTSKLFGGKTQLDVVAGHHRTKNEPRLGSATQDQAAVTYSLERSLYDFASLEDASNLVGCQDGGPDDMYPNFVNCPVTGYTVRGSAGIGPRSSNRNALVASLTQRAKFLGTHILKIGADLEFTNYQVNSRRPGGVSLTFSPDAFGAKGAWDRGGYRMTTTEFLAYNENGELQPVDSYGADTRNRNYGVYLQDSWQILPNLTVNPGIRWEKQVGLVSEHLQGRVSSTTKETIPDVAFTLNNMIAPRIGLVFDPSREGRSKLQANWGRYYETVPMDINVRAFGGEITRSTPHNIGTNSVANNSCKIDHNSPTLVQDVQACSVNASQVRQLGDEIAYFAPTTKGQYTEEMTLGAEQQLTSGFKVGASFVYRTLPSIIEDMSVDGGNHYFIGNPGGDYSGEVARLNAEAEQLMSTNPDLAKIYGDRATWLKEVRKFDKPVRNYSALQLTATQRPTANSQLVASYTYSRSKGNYPGLFSTETDQLDPNLTSMFDLPQLMANRYGAMGHDRPHLVKLDGFYQWDFKKAGMVVLGGSFRHASGLPQNTLAAHPEYGGGESFLLPRGTLFRGGSTMSVDSKVNYSYRLSKNVQLDLYMDVFNLFNQQMIDGYDATYTIDSSNPIVGGDVNDLEHAKVVDQNGNVTPVVVTPYKNYGKPASRQSPRFFQFGARFRF